MFFIGVFGIENKNEEIVTLNNLSCKRCNKAIDGKLIKNFDFFHFFFIPLFKWNETYYITCESCNMLYNISKEKGKAIEKGEDVNITYWDLQEMENDFYNDDYSSKDICPTCGLSLDKSFKYCPNCGQHIK
ncbi:zinc ribbon domain-containing protein [Clostridium uliginosum]|uniref:Zinc-ribbon family protein n=1 Tax=Clostridium uliginosum TaxID=119641 RepID=A0A1I1JHM4_9CLOT|nr:zinc ribbon domain-containing protein [Clostridium uliginosum]SFC47462.1 zinc-ribbon family protein [Clostridium uliginosum]